ncbi:MAG: hypothetical protein AAGH87_01825 [Pseudomonadota bacterium]
MSKNAAKRDDSYAAEITAKPDAEISDARQSLISSTVGAIERIEAVKGDSRLYTIHYKDGRSRTVQRRPVAK